MTVKERLHELIEGLDEEESKALLARLEPEFAGTPRPLSADEVSRIRAAMDEPEAGTLSTSQLLEELGIAD